MSRCKPLIGITPGFDYNENKLYINKGYYEAIKKVGGLPVIIPVYEETDHLLEIIERFDGFLLSGGPDVDAKYWGEQNFKFNGEISPYRDDMELIIAREAVSNDKPIFGICRGVQVMNIALGGGIYQDIYTQLKDSNLQKHSQEAPKWYPTHNVKIERQTKVFSAHCKDLLRVNSFHHQAIKEVAPNFIVSSRCEDGVIESIEHISCKFAVGVQWHPELMWEKDYSFLKLFENFVKSCIS